MLKYVASQEAQRLKTREIGLLKDSIDKETLEYLYIKYTMKANIFLSQIEHPNFRILLQYINQAINSLLPNSHNMIGSHVFYLFLEGKQ